MTAGDDDADGEKGGDGRSPRSGRFSKGQSGNLRGRPRKQAPPAELTPVHHPTRDLLRAGGARPILVTDGSGRQTVSTREGVLRALAIAAMRGGVLAARTFLTLHLAEDERFHRERMERFDFWLQYQSRQQALIAAAQRAGKAEPNPLPHPDDIRFDYVALEVQFLGAVDEEGRAREVHYQAVAPLAYEMVIYTGEDNCGLGKEGKGGRLGIYLALYVAASMILPPRLRSPIATFETDIMANWSRGRRAWGADLKRRCDIVGFPFSHGPSKALPFPYEKLGIMS